MSGRRLISSGSPFEEQIGYSRAVVDGDWVFVSGTTGFDYATMRIADDVVEQAEQCLANLAAALAEAGCTFADVVRVRYMLPDAADFEPCWPALRRAFGDVRPAATMIACGLSDPRMRIEIEVTARRRERRTARVVYRGHETPSLIPPRFALALTPGTAGAKEVTAATVCAAMAAGRSRTSGVAAARRGRRGGGAPTRPLAHFAARIRVLAEDGETVEWSYWCPHRGLMQSEDGRWMTMTPVHPQGAARAHPGPRAA